MLSGGALTGGAAAQDDDSDHDNGGRGRGGGAGNQDVPGTDVDVLNYALTLEHLEDAFYRDVTPSDETLRNSDTLAPFGDQIRSTAPEYIAKIGEHEATHVDVLEQVIKMLGGEPVPELEYEFGVYDGNEIDPDAFLSVAQALENTGVMAYDGSLALIESPDLQTAGATIATVEARHASYLNLLQGDIPFPGAFDESKSMDEINKIAGQFIVDSDD